MIFEQVHLPSLGHASYLVGSGASRQALVVDPRRDVEPYLELARRHGVRIRWVLDTHGHNDYLSGLTELAARTGAEALGSAHGELGYEHRSVKDGEELDLGGVVASVLHTPGHTPEHVSLLLAEDGDEPAILLSGGALLVGDVGRPDLLGGDDEAREAAGHLRATLAEKLLDLPDHVIVAPTHVSGSLCAGGIGSRLLTTVGYERRTNQLLADLSTGLSVDRFAGRLLDPAGLPGIPPYWARLRPRNLAGVVPLGAPGEPPALDVTGVREAVDGGALVLDARSPEAFGAGHVPGALNAGLGPMFATWAGTVLPEGARVVLVLDRPDDLWDATWQLLRIGFDVPVGWLAGGMRAWRTSGEVLEEIPQVTVHELDARRATFSVLDVRQPSEWEAGHIEGATFVTGAELRDRLDEVPDAPIAVVCGSGYRSSAAASLLARERRVEVVNVLGGMRAWKRAGYPTVTPT